MDRYIGPARAASAGGRLVRRGARGGCALIIVAGRVGGRDEGEQAHRPRVRTINGSRAFQPDRRGPDDARDRIASHVLPPFCACLRPHTWMALCAKSAPAKCSYPTGYPQPGDGRPGSESRMTTSTRVAASRCTTLIMCLFSRNLRTYRLWRPRSPTTRHPTVLARFRLSLVNALQLRGAIRPRLPMRPESGSGGLLSALWPAYA
jgi:hypothetical protein